MPAAAIALIALALAALIITGVALEHLQRQPAPNWRHIPHWKPERLQHLHVIDADLEGLDELATRTLLLNQRP